MIKNLASKVSVEAADDGATAQEMLVDDKSFSCGQIDRGKSTEKQYLSARISFKSKPRIEQGRAQNIPQNSKLTGACASKIPEKALIGHPSQSWVTRNWESCGY